MDKLKQTKNLLKKFIKDKKTIFYATNRITKTLLNKARKSLHETERFFINIIQIQKIKMCYMKAKAQRQEFLFILPLSNRKKDTDQSSALYSVKAFECVHANVVDI